MEKVKIYDLVLRLLREDEALRDSDKKLIWAVYEALGCAYNGYITKESFMKAPAEESITRARRKVQELHPELQSSEMTKAARDEKAEMAGNFIFFEKHSIIDKGDQLTF